jgi:hypothetical protein
VIPEAPSDATRTQPSTLTEFQRAHAEQLLAPLCEIPLHARQHVRRSVRLDGSSVILLESRPAFRAPQEWRDHPIAKFRWVKNRRVWQLFCVWRDLKWHRYEQLPESPDLAALVAEVRTDPTGIFFG